MKMWWAKITATFFYVGYMRPAPGTWGSVAALPMAWAIYAVGGMWLFLLAIPAAYIKGYLATKWMTQGQDDHDPSEVVIDEVVGQWIALAPVIIGATHAGVDVLALWPGWITALLAFRLFDIWKPGPVGWADRMHGPTGVMLDDVIAGVMAAAVVVLAAGVFHAL